MRIFLIRHGSTNQSESGRIASDGIDSPLSPRGVEEIRVLKGRLDARGPFETVFVSPAESTQETAHILFPSRKDIILSEALREIDKGFPAFVKEHPEYAAMTVTEWEARFHTHESPSEWLAAKYPSGTSIESFSKGATAGFFEIVKQHANAQSLAIVAHNGTIKSIIADALGTPVSYREMRILHGAYSELEYRDGAFRLVGVNI